MNFENKTVLITGASKGIGKAIALTFAKEGANVVLNASRKSQYFDELIAEFNEQGYSYVVAIGNVANQEDVTNIFSIASEAFGQVDILVNNAGITKDMLLMRMTEDQFDQVIDINLKGTFLCTKQAIRPMMKKRWGRIINVSSIIGLIGNPGQANYAASKAGIIGFSKSIAKEVGKKGITCNVVAPGFIVSDMTNGLSEELKTSYLGNIPVGRFGEATDVAKAVLFLASNQAEYITGQVLNIDGGLVM
ncbi:MAG: 3-oxoacyl-[acyl-carrier-protein] reductase [Clostridiales bacterium]|nr:3-oxoacyl-[acyl-carrier-protein] reductase [Clostridiales bacterium]